MSRVEVIITISVDPDGDGNGISNDAETLVDECCYYGGDLDNALGGAEDELRKALAIVEARADAAHPIFAASPSGPRETTP